MTQPTVSQGGVTVAVTAATGFSTSQAGVTVAATYPAAVLLAQAGVTVAYTPVGLTLNGLGYHEAANTKVRLSTTWTAPTVQPTNYTWSTDGLIEGQGTSAAVYVWTTGGKKTVSVVAESTDGNAYANGITYIIEEPKMLINAITYIQEQMLTVDGMREAQTYPPDKIGSYPFSTCYPGAGGLSLGNPDSSVRGLHSLVLEIHVARKDLSRDMERVLPFFDRIADLLRDDETLGGTVDTIVGEINYSFSVLNYFGQQTIGWQFIIPIKQIRVKIGA